MNNNEEKGKADILLEKKRGPRLSKNKANKNY